MEESLLDSVLVRKTEFGDFDYILTFFTREKGNITVIAKNAKKSIKRFSGKLELFGISKIMLARPKKGGLPVLTEIVLEEPFEKIRTDIIKTAYSSYWAELITAWIPSMSPQKKIYRLFISLLSMINKNIISPDAGNLYFQVHFLKNIGFDPLLSQCASCGRDLDRTSKIFKFRLDKGGILCNKCSSLSDEFLSGANIKQLLWIRENGFETALKLKFSRKNIEDCSKFLSSFISYNTGREFKSEKVIKNLESNLSNGTWKIKYA